MAQPAAVPIEIEQNGRLYQGTYRIDATGRTIAVAHGGKSKIVELGTSAPGPLARLMLRELVTGHKGSPAV
jgi:hypothetical protein